MSDQVFTVPQIADIKLPPRGVMMLRCADCHFTFPRPTTNNGTAKIANAHSMHYHEGKQVTLHMVTYSNAVEAMEQADQAPTAPLEEFIAAYFDDDNIWWRMSCGHHMNLFDAAIERIRELEQRVGELQNERPSAVDTPG